MYKPINEVLGMFWDRAWRSEAYGYDEETGLFSYMSLYHKETEEQIDCVWDFVRNEWMMNPEDIDLDILNDYSKVTKEIKGIKATYMTATTTVGSVSGRTTTMNHTQPKATFYDRFCYRASDAFLRGVEDNKIKYGMIPWKGPKTAEEVVEAFKNGDYEIDHEGLKKGHYRYESGIQKMGIVWKKKDEKRDEAGYKLANEKLEHSYNEFLDLLSYEQDGATVKKAYDKFVATIH